MIPQVVDVSTERRWACIKSIIKFNGRNKTVSSKLLAYGSTILSNIRDNNGRNLLYLSIKYENTHATKFLINMGCNVNQKDVKGLKPLNYALKKRNRCKRIVKLLLESGADISDLGGQLETLEFDEDNKEIVETLRLHIRREAGGTTKLTARFLQNRGWTLDSVASLKNAELTRNAVKLNESMEDNFQGLLDAVKNGDVLKVKLLINSVAHCKRITSWVQLCSVKSRKPNSTLITKLLIENGAPVNGFKYDKLKPLEQALIHYNFEKAWLLLDHGGNLDSDRVRMNLTASNPNHNLSIMICFIMASEHKNCRQLSLLTDLDYLGSFLSRYILCTFIDFYKSVYYYTTNIIDYINQKEHLLYPILDWIVGLHHLGKDIRDLQETCYVNFFRRCRDFKEDLWHSNVEYKQNFSSRYNIFDKYYEESNAEIMKMKKLKLSDHMSAWDFMTKSFDEIVPLTRNKKLMKNVKSIPFANKHSIHKKILLLKVEKACKKSLLIEESINILSNCLPTIGKFHLVLEKIVHYLGTPNMLILE